MSGFVFHPEAELDLIDIWEYIAADNLTAADRDRGGDGFALGGIQCVEQVRNIHRAILRGAARTPAATRWTHASR